MRHFIKSVVRMLPKRLQDFIYRQVLNSRNKRIVEKWKQDGSKVPPPHQVKQLVIQEYGKDYGIRTLIETGTYFGDMVEAQRGNFETIFSIELGEDLWKKACERFSPYPGIKILQGDSGVVLHRIMPQVDRPALFWLDGHFSAGVTAKGEKDCPIYEELDAIFAHSRLDHVILIDDARCFVGEGDYPTIENLSNYIRAKNSGYDILIKDDIIRAAILKK